MGSGTQWQGLRKRDSLGVQLEAVRAGSMLNSLTPE